VPVLTFECRGEPRRVVWSPRSFPQASYGEFAASEGVDVRSWLVGGSWLWFVVDWPARHAFRRCCLSIQCALQYTACYSIQCGVVRVTLRLVGLCEGAIARGLSVCRLFFLAVWSSFAKCFLLRLEVLLQKVFCYGLKLCCKIFFVTTWSSCCKKFSTRPR